MPRGTYARFTDGRETAIESFTSAPGPMGWRYYATVDHIHDGRAERIDLSVDARGRPVRIRVAAGEHELMVVVRGTTLAAIHDGSEVALEYPAGTMFAYPSPGFYAVALDRLTDSTDEVVLAIDPATLSLRPAPRIAELIGDGSVATPAGAFDAQRWRVDGREVSITGTVVIGVEGLAELRAYEAGATGPQPRLHTV